jgi:hypothetical protein
MRPTALALLAALAALPAGARAQSLLEGWDEGSVTVYGWLPGIQGSQERRDGAPLVQLDSADIIDALDFAFFGAGEIRRDRLGFFFDFEYADLSQDGTAKRTILPGADPSSANVGTTLTLATAAAAWRLVEEERGWVDVYGGLRVYDIDATFGYRIPALDRKQSFDANANWIDGIVGLRGHAALGDRFGVTALADVGGGAIGESELAWQATGTLDYAFTEAWVGRIGYRYMRIDYASDDLSMDIDIFGPVAGVTWRF